MADNIRVLLTEEEVNKRISEVAVRLTKITRDVLSI